MATLGERVVATMEGAGIKARTFAALVGCHYTTIYYLIDKKKETAPLRIVQERIHEVLGFLEDAVEGGLLPLKGDLSASEKTRTIQQLYDSYKNPPNVHIV